MRGNECYRENLIFYSLIELFYVSIENIKYLSIQTQQIYNNISLQEREGERALVIIENTITSNVRGHFQWFFPKIETGYYKLYV